MSSQPQHTYIVSEARVNEPDFIHLAKAFGQRETDIALIEREHSGDIYLGLGVSEKLSAFGHTLLRTSISGYTSINIEDGKAIINSINEFTSPKETGLHPLIGAAIGTIGYEAIQYVEKIPVHPHAAVTYPDINLIKYSTHLIYEKASNKLIVSTGVLDSSEKNVEYTRKYHQELIATIKKAPAIETERNDHPMPGLEQFNSRDAIYDSHINTIKKHIAKGDVFQTVPSESYETETDLDAFELFSRLSRTCPASYQYLIKTPSYELIGASPETLIKVHSRKIQSKPIAGTVKLTETMTPANAIKKLMNDKKECAEHTMLVDLARNDVGRVAKPGSVTLEKLMQPVINGCVLHMVSTVSGQLESGVSPIDAFFANFPAGTLSGAPKIRAMELIHSLESTRRNFYGGALIIADTQGDLDTAILIRTLLKADKRVKIQSGGGIVKNSDNAQEIAERKNKILNLQTVFYPSKERAA